MRKLFTLLTLLVCLCTGAWAAGPTDPSASNLTAKSFNETTLLWTTASNAATWYSDGWCVSGKSGSRGSFSEVTGKSYKIEPTTDEICNTPCSSALGLKADADSKTVYFYVTNIMKVEAYGLNTGSGERSVVMDITPTGGNKINVTETSTSGESVKLTKDGLDATKSYMVKIYASGGDMALYAIRFTVASTGPSISASPQKVTLAATESDVAVNSSFTITGSNLTAGTYDLTIPSVTGLVVSPTSFTVDANGTVSQEVKLSYSSTENVPANTANITATVNDLNLSVAVNYSASVTSWTLQTINTAKTWDFSQDVSGGKQYTTAEEKNTEFVYANISELSYSGSFDATALAFKGEYPFRDNSHKYAQNGVLRFNTTVPGTINVKFSDTGSSASATAVKRYLVVNDEQTEYWASRENNGTENPYPAQQNVTTGEISVPAGDVTIKGSSAIIVSYLSFTPAAASVSVGPKGFATYCNADYALDFTGKSIEAYTVSSNGGTSLSLNKKEKVAKGEPVLLYSKTASDSQMIPAIAESEATADNTNKLVAGNGSPITWTDDNPVYILYTGGATPGFYRANNSTVAANKAYLDLNGTAGARAVSFSLNFDDVTAISEVATEEDDKSAPVYDLQGRRVAQPAKGLYIVNGKKVIIK